MEEIKQVNEKKLFLSFIVPVYNVENYLRDCLDSLLTQNVEQDEYEIICVNDGSTDGSLAILREYEKEYKNVRVIDKENAGVSSARNVGLQAAQGEYVWFVDSDDMLYKNVVSLFYKEAKKLEADVFIGNYSRISEETKGNEDFFIDNSKIKSKPTIKTTMSIDENGRKMNAVWAGIFLRDFLLENNLYMNEKMSAQEDTLFYYEFEQKTKKIYKWEVPCYLYRQRKMSVMHSHNENRNKQYYLAMVEMLRVYQEHKENGEYLDLPLLEHKIHHSKQNIATCLASVKDKTYIKEQLKWLKARKIYPYKFRKDALRGEGSLLKKMLIYLMPLKLFFWLYHWIYQKSRK